MKHRVIPSCLVSLLMVLLLFAAQARGQGPQSVPGTDTAPNEGTTGTVLYYLAKKVPGGAGGLAQLVLPQLTDTSAKLYVVMANAGTTGTALYMVVGEVPCVFDNLSTGKGGTPVVMSTITRGRCHQVDAPPANGMVIGELKEDNTNVGQASLILAQNIAYIPGSGTGTGGTVTSVGVTPTTEFSVAPSSITTNGTFIWSKTNQSANCVMAGPGSGAAAPWNCRSLVLADLPSGIVPSGACGGDLASTYPNCTVKQASGAFGFPGPSVSGAISGDADNYTPTNWTTSSTHLLSGNSNGLRINGFAAGPDGDVKQICNAHATNTLVLTHQGGTSTAANRMDLTDDVLLRPGACFGIRYYGGTVTRWRAANDAYVRHHSQRPFSLTIGDPDPSSPLLLDGNDSPTVWTNMLSRPVIIRALACKAMKDTLQPHGTSDGATGMQIVPVLTGQSDTSIISGGLTTPCTCGDNTFQACTLNGTPTIQPATNAGATCSTPPCSIDFNIKTAGGNSRVVIGNFDIELQ